MKILITGAAGFLGKNLTAALECIKNGTDTNNSDLKIDEIYLYGKDDGYEILKAACTDCDFVFHFAGVNKTDYAKEFYEGNVGSTRELISTLSKVQNNCPIVFASSEKAEIIDSDYGKSKREAEVILRSYSRESGADVMIYRFPHVFGKWGRANYNSAVATFCYNTARLLPIDVIDENKEITLVYIDDLVKEMLSALRGQASRASSDGVFCTISPSYRASVGEIASTVRRFEEDIRSLRNLGAFSSEFEKKLFSTYLSYIQPEAAVVPFDSKSDERGSFTELMRGDISGLISLNLINPNFSKGGHWHNSKCEIFLPVSGEGVIRQRRIGDSRVYETKIDAKEPAAVYVLPGYTHSITNSSSDSELAVLIWVSEEYDPANTDTYKEDV